MVNKIFISFKLASKIKIIFLDFGVLSEEVVDPTAVSLAAKLEEQKHTLTVSDT